MLLRLGILLIALWLLALVNSYTMGGLIHVLPAVGVVTMLMSRRSRSM